MLLSCSIEIKFEKQAKIIEKFAKKREKKIVQGSLKISVFKKMKILSWFEEWAETFEFVQCKPELSFLPMEVSVNEHSPRCGSY